MTRRLQLFLDVCVTQTLHPCSMVSLSALSHMLKGLGMIAPPPKTCHIFFLDPHGMFLARTSEHLSWFAKAGARSLQYCPPDIGQCEITTRWLKKIFTNLGGTDVVRYQLTPAVDYLNIAVFIFLNVHQLQSSLSHNIYNCLISVFSFRSGICLNNNL